MSRARSMPWSLGLVGALLACAPRETEPAGPPPLPALDAVIVAEMARMNVPGLQAAIVEGGRVVWTGSYGFADVQTGEVVTEDTLFLLASVSKAVTGVALMQLWETGAFELDDDVEQHLSFRVRHPAWPQVPITPFQLLTHTSGIHDRWGVLDRHYVIGDSPLALGDFLAGYLDPSGVDYAPASYRARPGAAYEYSNVGAALAGHLVEAISGVPFDVWCEDHIFTPLGMDSAGWHLADVDEALVAQPHVRGPNGLRPLPHYGFPDYPDGQLRASAGELARLLAAFASDGEHQGVRILEAATADLMQTPWWPSQGQGLAWYAERRGPDLYVGHNGGETGASTEMFYRLADGTGFVVLMNAEPTRWASVMRIEQALMAAADQAL